MCKKNFLQWLSVDLSSLFIFFFFSFLLNSISCTKSPILSTVFTRGTYESNYEKRNLLPFDLTECVERGECGVVSIGSYQLEKSLRGYVLEVKNGLDYDITYYWNSLEIDPYGIDGNEIKLPNSQDSQSQLYKPGDKISVSNLTTASYHHLDSSGKKYVPLKVRSNSVRYFDTGTPSSQIVRLYVKTIRSDSEEEEGSIPSGENPSDNNKDADTKKKLKTSMESIDTVVARNEKKCGNGRKTSICSILLRICLGFHYGGGISSSSSSSSVESSDNENENEQIERCNSYYDTCKGFQKNTEGEECIQSCVYGHFSQFLSENARKEGEEFSFDPLLVINCVAANKEHQDKIKSDPKMKETWKKISSSWVGSPPGVNKGEEGLSLTEQLRFGEKSSFFSPEIDGESWNGNADPCTSSENAVAALSIILVIFLLFGLIYCMWDCRNKYPDYWPSYLKWNNQKRDAKNEEPTITKKYNDFSV
jgi:hypothetical protein